MGWVGRLTIGRKWPSPPQPGICWNVAPRSLAATLPILVKDIPDPANLGCPIAEVHQDGRLIIGKTRNSGGRVSEQTVKEQLLYEVHDPRRYLTPDVVLDLGQARVEDLGEDRVEISGLLGHPRPYTLKGLAGVRGLWFGEAEISYAGPGAVARAALAREILLQRFDQLARGYSPRSTCPGLPAFSTTRAVVICKSNWPRRPPWKMCACASA